MTCEYTTIDEVACVKCKGFLFVTKNLNFEESAEFCRNNNLQLAKINIKPGGEVADYRFKMFEKSKLRTNYGFTWY